MSKPLETLRVPQPEQPVSDTVGFILGGNFASPAFGVYALIEKAINVNIPNWLASQVGGDWEAVSRAANAAGNLAAFNTAFSDSVENEWKGLLEASWKGNAADGARSYFSGLAGQLDFQVSALNEIDRQLQNIADSMANLTRVLSDLIQFLSDLAIIYGIEALVALGPNPDPTGVSRAAAVAAMVATTVQMFKTFSTMVGKVAAVYDGFVAVWSILEVQVSRTDPSVLPELGSKSYDHPGV